MTALIVTVATLALLFAYKPSVRQLAARAPSPTPSPPTPSPSGAPFATPPPIATPTPAPAASPPAAPSGTFTGADVMTPYGDVQVKVVVSGGRLADVQAVHLPSDRARSEMISQYAGPQLRQEAIQARSANIDVVSGATFTSEAYIQSLGDALHRAHVG